MNPLRSVGARLSLALLVVVFGALGLVYLVVVPQLQRPARSAAKVAQLEQVVGERRRPEQPRPLQRDDWVRPRCSAQNNARVILYSRHDARRRRPPPSLLSVEDSHGTSKRDIVQSDPIALHARPAFGRMQSGRSRGSGEQFAEVADTAGGRHARRPLLRTPLHDTLTNVKLVQRRLLWAGLAALLLALGLGYGGASLFTRRIRRLERAADRIADGRFDEPVEDSGQDELAQLARTFERMRQRLAHLDRARREFIANASHELRTPLFSLGGFLELLTDEELDEGRTARVPGQHERAGAAARQARHRSARPVAARRRPHARRGDRARAGRSRADAARRVRGGRARRPSTR